MICPRGTGENHEKFRRCLDASGFDQWSPETPNANTQAQPHAWSTTHREACP